MGAREIASDEGITARQEKLPSSIVHYPGFYGTFFTFQEDESAPLTFCLCAKEAIVNYIDLQLRGSKRLNRDPNRNFILDASDFPVAIPESLREAGVEEDESIINHLSFEDGLCHDCNDVLPQFRYCHDMYGTKFMQNYGWYVNKKHFEFGVSKKAEVMPEAPIRRILFDSCPEDVLALLDDDIEAQVERLQELQDLDQEDTETRLQAEYEQLWDSLERQNKRLSDLIENEVRQSFGHYKKGNRWTSETILSQLVASEYPEFDLRRHHRPEWLNGLELDVYLEEPAIGIEYQGVQHYKVIDHWGGEEGLEQRQQRDAKKRRLCEEHDIELIEFFHDEELSEASVREKIDPVLGASSIRNS